MDGSNGGGILGGCGPGNGSVLSVYRRGSKNNIGMNRGLSPYRTQQPVHKPLPIGGSMQNMSPLAHRPPRRSSAVGISNNGGKSTLPASYRSHSVDGLLDSSGSDSGALCPDQRIAEVARLVAAGSTALTNASSTSTLQPNDDYNCISMGSLTELKEPDSVIVPKREKSMNSIPPNAQHRKSRSLDHFLDEQTLALLSVPIAPAEGTQSMQNLATPLTPQMERDDRLQQTQMQPDRGMEMRHNAKVTRPSPEGVSSTEDEHEDTQSLCSNSLAGNKSQTRASAHLHRGNQNFHNKTSSTSLGSAAGVGASSAGAAAAAAAGATGNNNKTIFNRTLKKVRSLMKKP